MSLIVRFCYKGKNTQSKFNFLKNLFYNYRKPPMKKKLFQLLSVPILIFGLSACETTSPVPRGFPVGAVDQAVHQSA
jgi:hypothetical protein